ncbi:NmrA family NAD(P)-binding protein [Streptomyces sp. PU10]|uniref:NmrA family NAD(P)-binding protein n=1 Tax=unclassified Streptomyces TaxID=2593676 RepID=UPI0028FC5945|nr:NmrA family NAD(P)-binding protein [Streptomyces sp. PU10]MDU0253984.1 NmrA family NAD(P)-binding protein [Streptomyces sp. PU10]
MPENRTVLVTGATGGQGGAVARALLAGGWSVRALVRDPDKPAAKALRVLGAEPVTGDLDEPDSLIAATRGVHGVYSVQAADLTNPDPDAEVRQGTNIADAAEAAGVAHFVYGSVAAVGHGSGVRHFGTKERIEAHLDSLGLPVTVLRPTFFMENWHSMMPPAQDGERVASLALDADTPLQMIALGDLGRIAAEAFGAPEKYIGRKTEIAGDELTPGRSPRPSPPPTVCRPASSGSRSTRCVASHRSWRRCSTGSAPPATGPTSPHSGGATRGC